MSLKVNCSLISWKHHFNFLLLDTLNYMKVGQRMHVYLAFIFTWLTFSFLSVSLYDVSNETDNANRTTPSEDYFYRYVLAMSGEVNVDMIADEGMKERHGEHSHEPYFLWHYFLFRRGHDGWICTKVGFDHLFFSCLALHSTFHSQGDKRKCSLACFLVINLLLWLPFLTRIP